MAKCLKCNIDFASSDTVAKCVECSRSFHPACTRLGSQSFTKSKLKNWKCDSCHVETSSVNSNKSNDEAASGGNREILAALTTMRADINAHTDKKITEVTSSIGVLTSRFDKLDEKIKTMEVKQEELCKTCDLLEHDRDQLQGAVHDMQLRLVDAEQHSRCANLEIVGVPTTQREDVYEILKRIATVINVPFKREDVSIAHRLRLFSRRHTHPPIIVQFVSRSVRDVWLAATRRKKGFKTTDLAASLPPAQVYVNEQLTPHNRELMGYARRLVREKKLFFAGFFNGKVLIKTSSDPEASSFRVRELGDLEKYSNKSS